jgi:peroxiredoxin
MRSILLPVALAAVLAARAAAAEPEPRPLEIGAAAPDFSLPGTDGKSHSLADFAAAKLLAVVFTCNHCPTAQLYEERLKKLTADYREKGVAVVAISPNDPEALRLDELGYTDLSDSLEEMKIRAKDRAFNFPYLYDGETQKVSRAYGPAATPHVFLFDAERKLRYAGRIDDAEKEDRVKSRDLANAIDALLSGKPVPVERTRTFGCSVKWSEKRESAKRSLAPRKEEEITVTPIDDAGIKTLVANKPEKEGEGKLRLINVWATWCGPCVIEFPELVAMQRMYKHRGFELVTISVDEPGLKEKVLDFLKTQGATGRNHISSSVEKDKLADALDARWSGAIPHTLLVRPGGEVVLKKTGQIDPLEVRRAIVKALDAVAPWGAGR